MNTLTKAQQARRALKAWRAAHPEEYEEQTLRDYAKRWRKKNPNYNKEWHAANRDYVTMKKREYRARKSTGQRITAAAR